MALRSVEIDFGGDVRRLRFTLSAIRVIEHKFGVTFFQFFNSELTATSIGNVLEAGLEPADGKERVTTDEVDELVDKFVDGLVGLIAKVTEAYCLAVYGKTVAPTIDEAKKNGPASPESGSGNEPSESPSGLSSSIMTPSTS